MSAVDPTFAMRVFEEDLQNLLELTFPHEPVKERHLRQASVILRRWLCDNELRIIGAHLRVPISFPVLNDGSLFDAAIADPSTDYYLSAGVRFNGTPIQFLYHSSDDAPAEWVRPIKDPAFTDMKMSAALQKRVLYFRGETFAFGEVLRFACNKLGGAHLDGTREARQPLLDEAAAFLTFGPPEETLPPGRQLGVKHLSLEKSGTEVLSGISVILIAAAAMLVQIQFDGKPLLEFN